MKKFESHTSFVLYVGLAMLSFSFISQRSLIVSTTTGFVPGIDIDTLHYPEEKHFKNVQQLTFGGDNAEAYFSFDGKWLVFQKTNVKEGIMCDQIFVGKIPQTSEEKFEPRLVSTGKGRTTCGAFYKRWQACNLCIYTSRQ